MTMQSMTVYWIVCDRCKAKTEEQGAEQDIEEWARGEGWTTIPEGQWTCPACRTWQESNAAPAPARPIRYADNAFVREVKHG